MSAKQIQVNGSLNFMSNFEQGCQQRGIALYVLPPQSPKLNSRVERLNGECRREFWKWYEGGMALSILQQAFREFETFDYTERLH